MIHELYQNSIVYSNSDSGVARKKLSGYTPRKSEIGPEAKEHAAKQRIQRKKDNQNMSTLRNMIDSKEISDLLRSKY